MTTTQQFDPEKTERLYNEYSDLIQRGCYTEGPEEEYDDGDEYDGSYWNGPTNLSESLSDMEIAADAADYKIEMQPDKTFKVLPMSEEEKLERDDRQNALCHGTIAAQFEWQDEHKIVLSYGGYVWGKLPEAIPAYVVEVMAEVRENDRMMNYSWPETKMLTVRWGANEDAPVISDATDEEIALVKAQG